MTRVQALVAALDNDTDTLPERMGLQSDAIIIDQRPDSGEYSYETRELSDKKGGVCRLDIWHCAERGVGLSRNTALQRACGELVQFVDEDIVYDDGYVSLIEREFDAHPKADILLFNIKAAPGRETYHNTDYARVHSYSCGRYPAYAICARREALVRARVSFSLLFGGGARYSNGEDSLFLMDCLRAGLVLYRVPVSLGHEVARQDERGSTWFEGYTDRFYRDRGVLYHYLYGRLAAPMSLRFLLAHRQVRGDRSVSECYALMRQGILEARGKRA